MPFNGVNPSIRVYDYDVTNRKIVNFYQHYLPLDNLLLEVENKDIAQIEKDASDDEFTLKDDRRNRNSKFMKHPPDINRKKRDMVKDKKIIKVGKKGKGTPKYLRNPEFLKCLDSTTNILCVPSIKPKDCNRSMLKKMKSQQPPPPDCKNNTNSGPENIESTSKTNDPDKAYFPDTFLDTQTDESFPLNSDQKVQNAPEIASRNGDDKADISDEDNNTDQSNAIIDNDGLVEKWKFGFDASKDLNVTEFTPEQMLNVWSNMKIYGGRTFGAFEKQLVVLRNGFNCSKDQHAYIICSIRYVLEDELKDCLSEMDSKMPPPWNQAKTTPSTQKTDPINFTTAPTVDSSASATTLQDSDNTIDDITNSGIFSTKPPTNTTIKSDLTENKNKGAASSKEQVVTDEEGASSGVTAVVVLTLLVLIITGATILYKRRDRWRNRQSDEFLLTDSVFKYDGYSQVDQP